MNKLKLIPFVILSVLCLTALVVGVYAANASLSGTLSGTVYIYSPSGVFKYEVYQVVDGVEILVDTAYSEEGSGVTLSYGTLTFDCHGFSSPLDVSMQEVRIKITNLSTDRDYGAYFWNISGTSTLDHDNDPPPPQQARIEKVGDNIISDIDFFTTTGYDGMSNMASWGYEVSKEFYKHIPKATVSNNHLVYHPQTISAYFNLTSIFNSSNTINSSDCNLYLNIEKYFGTSLTKDSSYGNYVTNTDKFIKIPTTESSVPMFHYDLPHSNIYAIGVVIPYNESVTSIPNSCFALSGVNAVSIPSSITTIGNDAFLATELYGVMNIPQVTSLGESAFNITTITRVILGSGLTSIGASCFEGCSSLKGNINIPTGVTTLGASTFKNTTIRRVTIHSGITSIGASCFEGCSSLTGNITIPSGVTTLNTNTFKNTAITGLTLQSGLTTIGASCFEGCTSLTGSLVIPNTVTSLGNYAFKSVGCTSLTLGSGVQTIGWECFKDSSITGTLTIPGQVQTLGDDAFNSSALTGLVINSSASKTIGAGCFQGCSSLTGSLTIPGTVTSLGSNAFDGTAITGLTLNSGLQTIGYYCFGGVTTLVGSLTIPTTVTSIGQYAFYNTRITGLSLTGVSCTLGNYCFYNCTALTGSITIHRNAGAGIGEFAFANTAITGVVFDKNASNESNVTTIGNSCFRNCTSLTGTLTLPKTITTLGNYAFYNTRITNVVHVYSYNSYIQNIGDYCFAECSSLACEFYFDRGCVTIGAYAFNNSGLTGVDFDCNKFGETNLRTIGEHSFDGCSALTGSIIIPRQVTTLGAYAFSGTAITSLKFWEDGVDVSSIPAYLCNNCRYLCYLYLSSGITSVNANAFNNCYNMSLVINRSSVSFSGYQISVNLKNAYYCTSSNASLDDLDKHGEYGYMWMVFKDDNSTYHYIVCGPAYGYDTITVQSLGDLFDYEFYEIKSYGFYECTELVGLYINDGFCKNVGSYAFWGCTSLSNVNIRVDDNNYTLYLGSGAFCGCTGLVSLNFTLAKGSSVLWVDFRCFYDCSFNDSAVTGTSYVIYRVYDEIDGDLVSGAPTINNFFSYTGRADYLKDEWCEYYIKLSRS